VLADSEFSPPLVYLAEINARQGDVVRTRQLVTRFRQIGTDSTYARELGFLLGCLERGPAAMTRAELGDSVGVTLAAIALAADGSRLDCAEAGYRRMLAVADLPPEHRRGLVLGYGSLLMAEGRYGEMTAFLDSALVAGYRGVFSLYVYDAVLGAPTGSGAAKAERVARQAGGDLYAGRVDPANRWLLGLWNLREGENARAAAIAADMERVADSTGGRLESVLAHALAAHVAIARADTATALRHFGRLHSDFPPNEIAWTLAPSLIPTRLLQADVLLKLRRYAGADSVAAIVDHHQPVAALSVLPRVLGLRARIAEAAGQRARAREFAERARRLTGG
jgi:hypothetical protein